MERFKATAFLLRNVNTFSTVMSANIMASQSTQSHGNVENVSHQQSPRDQDPRMEKTINRVQLLGRVGRDAKQNGSKVATVFSLATSNIYRYESGEVMQRTDWHNVVCFDPALRNEVSNFVKKGQRVLVTGRMTYGEVTEGDPGKNTPAIVADDVIIFKYSESI